MRSKTTTKTKIYRNLYLPKSLDERLKEIAETKIQLYKYYHFVYLLTSGTLKDKNKNLWLFKPLCSYLLAKIFTTKYNKVINALKANYIIESDNIFHEGKCFKYRILPEFFENEDSIMVKFSYKNSIPLDDFIDNKQLKKDFVKCFNNLDIPYVELYKVLEHKLNALSIDDFDTNAKIIYKGNKNVRVLKNYVFIERHMPVQEALKYADINGVSLIQDKDKLYLMNETDFLYQKERFIKLYWSASIENLKSEDTISVSRDRKTKRLHTNFTTMPNELFQVICNKNRLVEFDLRNAQPTLLTNLLINKEFDTTDFKVFKALTISGKLYEYFAEEFNLTRKEAKAIMFPVLFSSHKFTQCTYKKKFEEHFPSVANWINNFKKDFGKSSLAIKLQGLESNLFIDQIYKPLIDKGILIFTKHDSIACFYDDKDIVESFINEVFQDNKFYGKLESNQSSLQCAA